MQRATPPDVMALYEWADDHEDIYSGLHYTRHAGGVSIELFTSADPGLIAEQVRPLLSDPQCLTVRQRDSSLAELSTLALEVLDAFRPVDGRPGVVSTCPDLDRQMVGVALNSDDEQLRRALHDRFKDRVYVDSVGVRYGPAEAPRAHTSLDGTPTHS